MISFIIPFHTNRADQLNPLCLNINTYYPDSEIIISEQDDNTLFKRGQLCNLGFTHSIKDVIIFLDVDIRFMHKLNFEGMMSKYNQPYLPWDHRCEISESNNIITLLNERHYTLQGYGGCSVLTRRQFILSNGFSNLCFGWGAEDTILNIRVDGFKRIPGDLYHVKHESFRKEFNPATDKNVIRNRHILKTHSSRPPESDSYLHTTADKTIFKSNNIQHIKFKNISVTPDYTYKQLMNLT